MKLADVNGQRQEARPKSSGSCPACGSPVIAKCGEIKLWHWAHRGERHCDSWWENETGWHREWKGRFPISWQEVVCRAANGEKHVADVKTDGGWVLEFQHSPIKPEERRSRDAFYSKLVWIVNGSRLVRDREQFSKMWQEGVPVGNANSSVRQVRPDESALLRRWIDSDAPVFFDFGGVDLAWLLFKQSDRPAYVARFPRTQFVEVHLGGETQNLRAFDDLVNDIGGLVAGYEQQQLRRATAGPLPGFQRYLVRRRRL